MISIRYVLTGTVHGVRAGGGPADGSLYGFQTACGDVIADLEQWSEQPGVEITCKVCLRSQQADASQPPLTPAQHRTLKALYAGGHIGIGTFGGMTGFVSEQGGRSGFRIHSNTGKSLLNRQLIQREQGKGYVITAAGCAALGQPFNKGTRDAKTERDPAC